MQYHGAMDYSSWYERISRPFRTEGASRALNAADRGLVALFAVAYVALLAALALHRDPRLLKALLVPAATFALTSLVRGALNRPRPYEKPGIDPVISKDTQGKSMPSRHMASATVIACTFAWILPPLGAALLATCACVAFIRIVGGVHFPSDIAVAAAVGLAVALIGYVVAP